MNEIDRVDPERTRPGLPMWLWLALLTLAIAVLLVIVGRESFAP